jgi:restriction system protein
MIPDYQTLMLPLLHYAGDGNEHRIGDVIEPLAKQLGLTDAELAEMLPSGRQPLFNNRVHWAKTYLAQAKLLEITRRAYFRITERGLQVLQEKPEKVDLHLLERFPEFIEFKARSREAQKVSTSSPTGQLETEATAKIATPDELLRTTVADLETVLASELLDRILAAPPAFFENLIVTLLLSMGYGGSREGAGRAIGKSGDGGIDGVIDQDVLGVCTENLIRID